MRDDWEAEVSAMLGVDPCCGNKKTSEYRRERCDCPPFLRPEKLRQWRLCSGRLYTQKIDGPAEVTLMAPPPLEKPIALVAAESGGYEAVHNGAVIARAKPAQVDAAPPPVPSFAAC